MAIEYNFVQGSLLIIIFPFSVSPTIFCEGKHYPALIHLLFDSKDPGKFSTKNQIWNIFFLLFSKKKKMVTIPHLPKSYSAADKDHFRPGE